MARVCDAMSKLRKSSYRRNLCPMRNKFKRNENLSSEISSSSVHSHISLLRNKYTNVKFLTILKIVISNLINIQRLLNNESTISL